MDPVWSWGSQDFISCNLHQTNDSKCNVPKNKYICSLDPTEIHQWGGSTYGNAQFFDNINDNKSGTGDMFPVELPMPDGTTGQATLRMVKTAVPPGTFQFDFSTPFPLPETAKPILQNTAPGYSYFISIVTNMTVKRNSMFAAHDPGRLNNMNGQCYDTDKIPKGRPDGHATFLGCIPGVTTNCQCLPSSPYFWMKDNLKVTNLTVPTTPSDFEAFDSLPKEYVDVFASSRAVL